METIKLDTGETLTKKKHRFKNFPDYDSDLRQICGICRKWKGDMSYSELEECLGKNGNNKS
ncbi:MAG: hypothetical protein A2W75_04080 [Nitrospinae bacterium RIFCSPLOWO2_12_39_15]|nr:MAG: hypothetical protein A2W75_04080 [Nitrospinae bacterium RIFCSPLOWO2_12_39_15]